MLAVLGQHQETRVRPQRAELGVLLYTENVHDRVIASDDIHSHET